MSQPLKVLIVLTSHSDMGDGSEPTGFWLEEFTTPYYVFADAGADIHIASIRGGRAPLDPRSLAGEGDKPDSVKRYEQDTKLKAALESTAGIAGVAAEQFDIVFLPGGHGTMWDLPNSEPLAKLVGSTMTRGAVVSAVCHGPAGLVGAKLADGRPVVAGRRVSAFINSEEKAVGLDQVVPFLLESRLRELGGRVEGAPDFQPFAVADGNLVTGQNPASSGRVAELAIQAARARLQAKAG